MKTGSLLHSQDNFNGRSFQVDFPQTCDWPFLLASWEQETLLIQGDHNSFHKY